MLKYEEKLHFDEHYRKLQSNSFLQATRAITYGVVGYIFLYFLVQYVFLFIPDFKPWNEFETWFTLGSLRFVKADLVYFTCGLITNCYGILRLLKIMNQIHSVKNEKEDGKPLKLSTNGYYAKVRHPMYGTFILLQAGFMLSLRSFVGLMIALMIVITQYINAIMEEKKKLVPTFGEEYYLYMKNVGSKLLTKPEIIIFSLATMISVLGLVF